MDNDNQSSLQKSGCWQECVSAFSLSLLYPISPQIFIHNSFFTALTQHITTSIMSTNRSTSPSISPYRRPISLAAPSGSSSSSPISSRGCPAPTRRSCHGYPIGTSSIPSSREYPRTPVYRFHLNDVSRADHEFSFFGRSLHDVDIFSDTIGGNRP